MNVIVLMAGPQRSALAEGPSALVSVGGQTVIEKIAQKIQSIQGLSKVIFVIKDADKKTHHIDSVIRLAHPEAQLLSLPSETKGAACSALCAINLVDLEGETLILNGDEFIDADFETLISYFRKQKVDGGIVTFESVHPSYSFASINQDGDVEQIAEKNPISRSAMVGFHYFRTFQIMVDAVKNMIRKDAHVNGAFYVGPAYNEMILSGLKVKSQAIDKNQYHPLKSDLQITSLVKDT